MVTPAVRRAAVAHLEPVYEISGRRARSLNGADRTRRYYAICGAKPPRRIACAPILTSLSLPQKARSYASIRGALTEREVRSIICHMKVVRFPACKGLPGFDFLRSKINEARGRQTHRRGFTNGAQNAIADRRPRHWKDPCRHRARHPGHPTSPPQDAVPRPGQRRIGQSVRLQGKALTTVLGNSVCSCIVPNLDPKIVSCATSVCRRKVRTPCTRSSAQCPRP